MIGGTDAHATDLPRWRQIELALLKEINAGTLKVGEKLPGEHTLAPQFGVTRATLRRALTELQNKGVIRVEKGRGSFVQRRLVEYKIGAESSFKANLLDNYLLPNAEIFRKFETIATADVAERLSLDAGAGVVVLDTIGKADDTTISLTRHHLPAGRFKDALERIKELSCITDAYELYGYRSTKRMYSWITARLPTREEASRLGQPLNEPILEVASVKADRRGRPLDFTVACFAATRVSLFVGKEGRSGRR